MKSVLLSIQPQWCEKIASGKKTLEIRKTRPKLDTPFKVYIYQTQESKQRFLNHRFYSFNVGDCCVSDMGKVIGEFVCDSIDTYDDDAIHAFSHEDYAQWNDLDIYRACIHPEDFEKYAKDAWLYGWHISDLNIYDKPRELIEFRMKRPPMSWCYVEELI